MNRHEIRQGIAFIILCLTASTELPLHLMYWYLLPLGIAGYLIFKD